MNTHITRIGGTKRYSDIVVHNKIVYLSGVVPSKDGTIYEQTKEVFSLIDANLKCVGSSKYDILTMTIYLKDETEYEAMNVAFDEWGPSPPARATIGVRFPNPLWKLEIVLTATISPVYFYNHTNIDYVI